MGGVGADEDEACVCVGGGHAMVVTWLLGGVGRGGEGVCVAGVDTPLTVPAR